MTISPNKMLEILHVIQRKSGEPLSNAIEQEHRNVIAKDIAQNIQNSLGYNRDSIVSIARKQVISLVKAAYEVELTTSNLTHMLKQHSFDLIKRIQGELDIYSDKAEYEFKSKDNGFVSIDYYPNKAKPYPSQLLETLLNNHALNTNSMNNMWSKQGILGDSRTFFKDEVVRKLRNKRYSDINWPTCNTTIRTFAELLKPSFINALIDQSNTQAEFEKLVSDKCRSRSLPILPKSLESIRAELDAEQIPSAENQYQHLPYFYIYKTKDGTKIGSADKSLRITNVSGDISRNNALIYSLKYSEDQVVTAETVEREFRSFLSGCFINPQLGKKDHYCQDFVDILSAFQSFYLNNKQVRDVKSSVRLCSNFEYNA
ncbi:hypothetical protein BCT35_18155 [Vibrio lentus]|uniref:hypothetical protein n=1 Tax=Vibrio lentus TaxID=136468 RepID=UPI000C84B609|nr:hypothetical protein [Vibrio lentus]PML43806.1 hypothetical protein BCT75_08090 [Vibrio lentus]PMN30802.1 hypothetical protein BCT35_18155 [Vibrio lentus]